MAEGQQLTENKDIHNSRLELVFEKRIPGLRVTEAVRHRDFIMRSKHFHEDIEVHFILSGQRLLFVDKETYHLTAHSCAMVDHDLVHRDLLTQTYFGKRKRRKAAETIPD